MSERRDLAPLIVLAYSHERNESKPPLRNLLKEQLQVSAMLAPMVQQNLCETRAVVNVTVERLSELIEREGERIVGLHYGSDVATLIRVREGKRKSIERALKGRLGRQLGALPRLKWVFLSGDGSQEQAEALLKVGVPLVMRSHNLISDDAAYRLAYFFYQALGQGHTLGQACELASFEVRRDYMNKAKLTYGHELPSGYGSEWPFERHVAPHLPSVETWSLYSESERSDGLPRVDERLLPELPFCDFKPITHEEAGLFGGRVQLSRQLHALLTAPQRPPVLVVYGPQGSGKSSLMKALAPALFKGRFYLKQGRFSPDGLSGLGEALGVDEHAPLLKEWLEQEGEGEQAQLNQAAINDLINEAQAVFKSAYKAEMADFPSFLQTIRAMWLKSDEDEQDSVLLRLAELFKQQERGASAAMSRQALPLLVCLDEVECGFQQNLDHNTTRRQQRFWALVRALCVDPDRVIRGALTLVIDEASYPQLKQLLEQRMIRHTSLYVPALSEAEVEGYLRRFVSERSLQERYPLITDERFARRAAQEVCALPHLRGTRLQALLRLMWRRSPKRPILWTEEALLTLKEQLGGLSLKALLAERVRAFTDLMRAQGDEEFNEHLALDVLYHLALCAYAPARFSEWLDQARPHFDDAEERALEPLSAERYGADSLAPQSTLTGLKLDEVKRPQRHAARAERGGHVALGQVSVGAFLRAYLGWGEVLPSPWDARRRALADQTLWAFMQAIELGVVWGKLGAGEELPTGLLSLPHPALFEVLEERWREINGLSIRQVQRFGDLLAQKQTPSLEECALTREAFLHTRLPHLAEAEALSRGLEEQGEREGRAEAYARRSALTRWAVAGLLLVSAARCAQLSVEREDVLSSSVELKDRVRLYAAERLSDRGELDLSAALLGEVERMSLEGWSKGAIQVLSRPISNAQLSDRSEWTEARFHPKAMWVSTKGGQRKLLPLGAGDASLSSLGAPLMSAVSPRGDQWCALEGEQLGFGTLTQRLGRVSLSAPQLRPKALLMSDEGVALLLDEMGALSLISPSGVTPVLSERPFVELSQSPQGSLIIVRDDEGSIMRVNLRARSLEAPLLAPSGTRLKRAEFSSHSEALILFYSPQSESTNATPRSRAQVRLLRAQGGLIELSRGDQKISFVAPSESGLTLIGETSGRLTLIDARGGARRLSTRLQAREALLSPEGERAVFMSKRGEVSWLDLTDPYKARSLASPEERPTLSLSDDGQHLLMQTARVARVWHMSDGTLVEDFEHPRGRLISARIQNQSLYAAFSSPQDEQSAHMKEWPLQPSPLVSRPYWPGDEVSSARFGVGDSLWVGTAKGDVYAWSPSRVTLKRRSTLHQGQVNAIIALPSGALLTASDDASLSLLSPEERAGRQLIAHEAPVTLLEQSEDGALIFSADRKGQGALWSSEGSLLSESTWSLHNAPLRLARISPDKRMLITSSVNGETKLWQLSERGVPRLTQQSERALVDARWLSREGVMEVLTLDKSGALERWSPLTGEGVSLLPALEGFEVGALSPEGKLLVRSTRGGQALLYKLDDPRSLRAPRELAHKAGNLSALSVFGPELVALGGEDGEVWLWSEAEGARRLGRHEGAVQRFERGAGGEALVSRSSTQALLWRGPFDRASLAARLRANTQLCLSLEERMSLLGESVDEARALRARCLERQQD